VHDRDQRVLSWLFDLDTPEQATALRQLGADDALRDIGDHLTIDRIRDVFKYIPATKLASQIRDALAGLLERTELPEEVLATPPARPRKKRREVNPPE
jgi:hypothetical protein